MLSRVSGALSFERATSDLQKVTRDLQDLQRQLGGYKANDLKTFGGSASVIVSTRSALSETAARVEVAEMAGARMQAQDVALERAHDVVAGFRNQILGAAANRNGVGLRSALEFAVGDLNGALNLQWDGQYVFGGDRTTAPVALSSPDALLTESPFQIVGKPPTLQLGDGQSVPLAEAADTFALRAYDALRQAVVVIGDGVALQGTLTNEQVAALEEVAALLESGRADLSAATSRNGEGRRAVENAAERLERRELSLRESLSGRVDADLGQVAIELAQKQSQYEAIARVIGELRNLNLLSYLD